ncbi:hypothetical protein ABT336_16305 [Micromonospora sp. NPDC000207]|uniref:hypothetical protein n=1 Tax=Micromonospora sp. NPDC000207 TaxID=3154246 RepID=UPI00332D5158
MGSERQGQESGHPPDGSDVAATASAPDGSHSQERQDREGGFTSDGSNATAKAADSDDSDSQSVASAEVGEEVELPYELKVELPEVAALGSHGEGILQAQMEIRGHLVKAAAAAAETYRRLDSIDDRLDIYANTVAKFRVQVNMARQKPGEVRSQGMDEAGVRLNKAQGIRDEVGQRIGSARFDEASHNLMTAAMKNDKLLNQLGSLVADSKSAANRKDFSTVFHAQRAVDDSINYALALVEDASKRRSLLTGRTALYAETRVPAVTSASRAVDFVKASAEYQKLASVRSADAANEKTSVADVKSTQSVPPPPPPKAVELGTKVDRGSVTLPPSQVAEVAAARMSRTPSGSGSSHEATTLSDRTRQNPTTRTPSPTR